MIKFADNLKNLLLSSSGVENLSRDRIPLSQLSPHQKDVETLPFTEGLSTFASELFNIPGAFSWWQNKINPEPVVPTTMLAQGTPTLQKMTPVDATPEAKEQLANKAMNKNTVKEIAQAK